MPRKRSIGKTARAQSVEHVVRDFHPAEDIAGLSKMTGTLKTVRLPYPTVSTEHNGQHKPQHDDQKYTGKLADMRLNDFDTECGNRLKNIGRELDQLIHNTNSVYQMQLWKLSAETRQMPWDEFVKKCGDRDPLAVPFAVRGTIKLATSPVKNKNSTASSSGSIQSMGSESLKSKTNLLSETPISSMFPKNPYQTPQNMPIPSGQSIIPKVNPLAPASIVRRPFPNETTFSIHGSPVSADGGTTKQTEVKLPNGLVVRVPAPPTPVRSANDQSEQLSVDQQLQHYLTGLSTSIQTMLQGTK